MCFTDAGIPLTRLLSLNVCFKTSSVTVYEWTSIFLAKSLSEENRVLCKSIFVEEIFCLSHELCSGINLPKVTVHLCEQRSTVFPGVSFAG